jgi:Flp pilus assembly protein TadG
MIANRKIARAFRARAVRIVGDRSGIAAVEFALLLPGLLTLFIGSYELSSLLLAYLKLESAAESAADLVGQTAVNAVLQSSDFTNITNALQQIMVPFSTSGTSLRIAYASVTYSTGSAVINWHTEVNGAAQITAASLPHGAASGTLGTATNGSLDSVIVAQLTYAYSSPVSYVLNTNYTLSEAAFVRPRYVRCVPTYLNTNTDGQGNKICP